MEISVYFNDHSDNAGEAWIQQSSTESIPESPEMNFMSERFLSPKLRV
jgi:hypothetical protein